MTEIDVDLPGAGPEKRSLLKPFLLVGLGLLIVFGGVFGWKAFIAYKTAEFMANMPARKWLCHPPWLKPKCGKTASMPLAVSAPIRVLR